jgi:hypothetical protein
MNDALQADLESSGMTRRDSFIHRALSGPTSSDAVSMINNRLATNDFRQALMAEQRTANPRWKYAWKSALQSSQSSVAPTMTFRQAITTDLESKTTGRAVAKAPKGASRQSIMTAAMLEMDQTTTSFTWKDAMTVSRV